MHDEPNCTAAEATAHTTDYTRYPIHRRMVTVVQYDDEQNSSPTITHEIKCLYPLDRKKYFRAEMYANHKPHKYSIETI